MNTESGLSQKSTKSHSKENLHKPIIKKMIIKKQSTKTTKKIKYSYFYKSIKTGSDFVYKKHFQNKKIQIMDELSKPYKKSINNDIKLDISRVLLILLGIDYDINFDNENERNYILKPNKKSSNSKGKKKAYTYGGMNFDNYNELIKNYLLNQYIFDCNHDFGTEFTIKSGDDTDDNSFGKQYVYTDEDINAPPIIQNELIKLYKKNEKEIFYDFILKDYTISSRILYFSIFDFINFQIKDYIGKSIYAGKSPTEIIEITKTMQKFIETIIGHNSKFITDCNLSRGIIDIKHITNTFGRLNIPITYIDDVIKYKKDYAELVGDFNKYLNNNRVITLEDCFDPAGVQQELAEKYMNELNEKKSLVLFSYITSILTDESENNKLDIPDELRNLFMSLNKITRQLFICQYYKDGEKYKPCLIFKNTDMINFVISIIKQISKPALKNLINKSGIYERTDETLMSNYAYDLFEIKNFNSIQNIKKVINKIIKKIKEKDTLYNFINSVKISNNMEFFMVIYCYCCFIKEYIKSDNNDDILSFIIPDEIHKKVARVYFDFKYVGDLSKVLFVFYYNYLNNLNLPELTEAQKNIQTYFIPGKLHFSSNDILTTLASILRKSNTVCYSDVSSFSINIYNHMADENINTSKLFLWFSIYFNNKFLPYNFNIEIFDIVEKYIQTKLNPDDTITKFLYNFNEIIKSITKQTLIDVKIKEKNKNTLINFISYIDKEKPEILQIIPLDKYQYLKDLIRDELNETIGISNYIKLLFVVHLEELIEEVKKKLLSEFSIDYFTLKIFFNKIKINKSESYYKLFYLIVKKYLEKLNENFENLIKLLINEIKTNTTYDFTDTDNIQDILIKIESIIKIIELFLYIEKPQGGKMEIDEPSTTGKKRKLEGKQLENKTINNIFDFYEDLNSYVSQIIYYKYITDVNFENKEELKRVLIKPTVSQKPGQKLNIFSMLFSPYLLNDYIKDIFNVKYDDTIELTEKNKINFIKKMQSLFNSLFININIINYISTFQKYNEHFNQLLSSDFKFLGVSFNIEIINAFKKFIYDIKKIYYYSFIQIYSLGYYDTLDGTETEIEHFFKSIKQSISENISIVASSKTFKNKQQKEIPLTVQEIAENEKIGNEMIFEISKKIDELQEKITSFDVILETRLTTEEHKKIIIYKRNPDKKQIALDPSQAIQISLESSFTERIDIITSLIEQFNSPILNKISLITDQSINEDFNKLINIYNYLLLNEKPLTVVSGGKFNKKFQSNLKGSYHLH